MQSDLRTRRSLIKRLENWEDQESWQQFFDTYWKLIFSVALQAGLSNEEAQDVVQETVLAVARKMRQARFDHAAGSFKGWLLLITRRRIADQFRKRRREPPHDEPHPNDRAGTAAVDRIPDRTEAQIAAVWEAEWQNNIVGAAIDRIRAKVRPKQFQIFDCYVLKEWPVAEVTRTLGVSPNQVYLAKKRISALIAKEIEQLERKILHG